MGFAKEIVSLRFLVRTVLTLLMLLLLLDVIATHSRPVSSVYETPLTIAGWLAIPVVIALSAWHYRRYGESELLGVPKLNWRVLQHLVFVAIMGLTLYFATTGNVSLGCPASANITCAKTDPSATQGAGNLRAINEAHLRRGHCPVSPVRSQGQVRQAGARGTLGLWCWRGQRYAAGQVRKDFPVRISDVVRKTAYSMFFPEHWFG